ncbi:MAG: hypothetical protein QUS11_09425 [Candidatus Fermentibacter sp.]|nr:hypothetical protein [Candidatus Fermentibacter sp.]
MAGSIDTAASRAFRRVRVTVEGAPGAAAPSAGDFRVVVSDVPGAGAGAHLRLPATGGLAPGVLSVLGAFDSPAMAARLLAAASAGLLAPMFVHVLNNSLVGLIGNLDLAAMYGWEGEDSARTCRSAAEAAADLSGRLGELSSVSEAVSDSASGAGPWLMDACRAACGRSVDASTEWPAWAVSFSPACLGLSAACLLSLGGAGRFRAAPAGRGTAIDFEWERKGPVDVDPAVKSFSVPLLVALSALSAFPGGGRLDVPGWGDESGTMRFLREGDPSV